MKGQSGPAETVATGTAGSPVGRSASQLEAAGAELWSASRLFAEDPALSAPEAEQPPADSSESEAGPASQHEQAQSDQEADPDVHARNQARTGASELTTRTDTGAEVDSSLVPGNQAEGKQEVASMSKAVGRTAGTSQGSQDHLSLHVPPADSSTAAGSASKPPSGGQVGPDESELQGGQGAQQRTQQLTEPAAAELLQSSSQRTHHDAMLSGKEQQVPSVTPPASAHEQMISNRSMQEGSLTAEEPPKGAASTSVASSKLTQAQVAGAEGPSTVDSTSGRQAAAASASDSPKPPASVKGQETRGFAPAVVASGVSTVRQDAPSEAGRPHAVPSSSATARNANKNPNESQEEETEAQVLSPKGSFKSRQTVEMKRQQTSFNPLG